MGTIGGHAIVIVPRQDMTRFSAGFTLIEMGIVLAVAGVLLVGVLDVMYVPAQHRDLSVNGERLAVIKKAMAAYAGRNGSLPCAAPRDVLFSDPNYGKAIADCNDPRVTEPVSVPGAAGKGNVRIGAVPARDLGLPLEYMADARSHLFTYAVSQDLTAAPLDPTLGAVDIVDAGGASLVTPAGSALYAVVSAGKDGKGAWSTQGVPVSPCNATAGGDNENCNDDHVFTVEAYSPSDGAGHFDDFVSYSAAINDQAVPVCPQGQTLSYNGSRYSCANVDRPPRCPAGKVYTTYDGGYTFVRAPMPVTEANPTCPAGLALAGYEKHFNCRPNPIQPFCPAGYDLSSTGQCTLRSTPSCAAGEALVNDHGTFSCVVPTASMPGCTGGQMLTRRGANWYCVSAGDTPRPCPEDYMLVNDNNLSYKCYVKRGIALRSAPPRSGPGGHVEEPPSGSSGGGSGGGGGDCCQYLRGCRIRPPVICGSL